MMFRHQVSVHGKGRGCFGVFLPFPTDGQPLYLLWYTVLMPNVCASPQKTALYQHSISKNTITGNI